MKYITKAGMGCITCDANSLEDCAEFRAARLEEGLKSCLHYNIVYKLEDPKPLFTLNLTDGTCEDCDLYSYERICSLEKFPELGDCGNKCYKLERL